jgi:Leucine-rich repeat (LRR) protein
MLKIISLISIWVLLISLACSTTGTRNNQASPTNLDTFYSASTGQLKSNKIPDSVFAMIKLRHLIITGMDCDQGDNKNCWDITEIPAAIKNLKDLVSLRLTVNAIYSIPIELTELKNLKLVDLSDDAGLTDLNNISKCKGLQYLYLYGCGLSKLPDNIGEITNLKDLGLAGNNFSNEEQARIKKALPNCKVRF